MCQYKDSDYYETKEEFSKLLAHYAAAVSAYEKFVGRYKQKGHADPFYTTRMKDFTKALDEAREYVGRM